MKPNNMERFANPKVSKLPTVHVAQPTLSGKAVFPTKLKQPKPATRKRK